MAFFWRRSFIYTWLSSVIPLEFEEVRPLKEGPRGGVFLLRHKKTGRLFVFPRFSGSREVYRKLLRCACRNLPALGHLLPVLHLGNKCLDPLQRRVHHSQQLFDLILEVLRGGQIGFFDLFTAAVDVSPETGEFLAQYV